MVDNEAIKQCMHSVIGECVGFNYRDSTGTKSKSPIYEAVVGEEKRRFTRSVYTNFSNPMVGDKSIKKFNLILGAIFVVAGFTILISLII